MVRKRWPFKRDDDIFEDWFDYWGKGFRDDIFDELEEHFRKMQRWMNDIFRDAMSGKLPSPEEGGPYIYGWSLRVGPDGKPHFEEFGNVPSMPGMPRQMIGAREPLVDVIEGDKVVTITAEVPGVSKEDIDLEITEDTVTIKVDKDERKYYKEVALPCEVDTDSAKASYQNGVLDIELKKVKAKRKGRKIKIN
ncbi:MAG: Hsp20/alpha crystallin family protein [Thermoplasmata archaeon]|nr:MAG: Hsp20/alpha crystallin family protein [Thermoplasmata archaeon]